PFITLTLALDYWLWGADARGFHLTNLIYQTASSILLFFVSRRLLNGLSSRSATLTAFFAAAFFAAQPLHPEVVSWVIARVDSVALTFYLLSFWLYLESFAGKGGRACLIGSLIA